MLLRCPEDSLPKTLCRRLVGRANKKTILRILIRLINHVINETRSFTNWKPKEVFAFVLSWNANKDCQFEKVRPSILINFRRGKLCFRWRDWLFNSLKTLRLKPYFNWCRKIDLEIRLSTWSSWNIHECFTLNVSSSKLSPLKRLPSKRSANIHGQFVESTLKPIWRADFGWFPIKMRPTLLFFFG